jgi:hypothetical protein
MIKWIRNKIRKFLGISDFENQVIKYMRHASDYNIMQDKKIDYQDKRIVYQDKRIDYQNECIGTLHTTIENVVHIGTDVHCDKQNHSWAVVCIEGKMNMVKFVYLGRSDAREILFFLKKYESGRHCIDSFPPTMFYDQLFKFYKKNNKDEI